MLNYEFPPLGGGAGNASYYLLREFTSHPDIKIDLVTASINGYKEEQLSGSIRIYYLPIGKSSNWHNQSAKELLTYSWKAFWKARALRRTAPYDLAHTFFGIPCGFIALMLRVPYVVSLRGMDVPFYSRKFYWLDRLFFRWLSVIIWRRAKMVIANSLGLRTLALQSNPHQAISVIPNGIDVQQFHPATAANNVFTVLTVARLIPRKGINYLIDGFAQFHAKYPSSRLIIAGDGPARKQLMEQANKSRIDNDVEFLGNIPHNRLPEIYRKADIFTLPSLNEGMSNSLLEALASGIAIITTPTGGTAELVKSNNGYIIPYRDSAAITQALEGCYRDQNHLITMKRTSRQIAKTYSWQNTANQYLSIYQKTCAESMEL